MDISPPLFLVKGKTDCWKCGESIQVFALLAQNVVGDEGEPYTLSEIEELPETVLSFIEKRAPNFRLTYSRTADFEYFANNCGHCGALIGDFFLHSEPGGAFFPNTEEEAEQLQLLEVPIEGGVEIEANGHQGLADVILANAKRSA